MVTSGLNIWLVVELTLVHMCIENVDRGVVAHLRTVRSVYSVILGENLKNIVIRGARNSRSTSKE